MKKAAVNMVIAYAIVIAALLSFSPAAHASNDPVTDALYSSPSYTQQIEETNQQIEQILRDIVSPNSTTRTDLNVPCYQQTANNCGIACMQMVINYLQGSTISQSAIQSYQTNTYGSEWNYVYAVTGGLNHYVSGYQYANTSNTSFTSSVIASINTNKPVICQVTTVDLPNYPPEAEIFDHYVVVTGYYAGFSGSSSVAQLTFNDPHYNDSYFGTFTCTFSEMETSIDAHSGYYIRGT